MNTTRSFRSLLSVAMLLGLCATSQASPASASDDTAQAGVVMRPAIFVTGTSSVVGMTLIAAANFDTPIRDASPRASSASASPPEGLQLPEPQPISGILATIALALFYFTRRAV